MASFENVRTSYRPDRIMTLFVGESAPHGGTFFYNKDSGLFRELRKAFQGDDHFLDHFKRKGFYLDDLAIEPVNHLSDKDRRAFCRASISSFVERLKDYKPQAVVILLRRIESMVVQAMDEAGVSCVTYCTPYPGLGHQLRFHQAMAEIVPNLPGSNTR